MACVSHLLQLMDGSCTVESVRGAGALESLLSKFTFAHTYLRRNDRRSHSSRHLLLLDSSLPTHCARYLGRAAPEYALLHSARPPLAGRLREDDQVRPLVRIFFLAAEHHGELAGRDRYAAVVRVVGWRRRAKTTQDPRRGGQPYREECGLVG